MIFSETFESDQNYHHRVVVFPVGGAPYEKQTGNIFVPQDWRFFHRQEENSWSQPEAHHIHKSVDQRRVHSGETAYTWFGFWRNTDAGLMRQVNVAPGAKLHLSAWMHAWSNGCESGHPDDGRWSDGSLVGYNIISLSETEIPLLNGDEQNDANGNIALMVGIDPTGGLDPYADMVEWSAPKFIYNGYVEPLEVDSTAISDTVTIFLRGVTLYSLKHLDVYVDTIELTPTGQTDPPPEPPASIPTDWDYPVMKTGSKLGVHSILPNKVQDFAQQLVDGGARFPVVKAVDDLAWLIKVKEISPKTITITRLTTTQELESGGDFSEGAARELMRLILDKFESYPEIAAASNYVELINEPLGGGTGPDRHRQLAQLMMYMMDIAEQHQIKLALPAFNTGCPEWEDLVAMAETGVFARMKAGGHILTTHEGWVKHDVKYAWPASIPGAPYVEGAGAFHFRYRYLYHILKQRNEVVPLVVSEWYTRYREGGASVADIVEYIRWWDSEASKDYYLWGCCPFTLGPTSGWTKQNYEFAYPALIDYMLSIKDQQNALPPTEPMPGETWGDPREQYKRTYILPPPDATGEVVKVIVDTLWDIRRPTIGGSADDSGLGKLNEKIVWALNPKKWDGDLKAFFEEYYPRTTYIPIEYDNAYQLAGRLLATDFYDKGLRLGYPVTGEKRITDEFGRWRGDHNHSGLDVAGTHKVGHQVLAAYPGKATHSGWMNLGFGYTVRIESVAPDGRVFDCLYAHLLEGSLTVSIGQEVASGDVLGQPNNSGESEGDHLHFQVNWGRKRLDPELLLDWLGEPVDPPDPPPDPLPTGNLISLHLQEWRDGADDFLNEKQPNVVKIFHPQDAARCNAMSPSTLVVLRLYRANQDLSPGQATRYVEEMKHDLAQANPHIDLVESFNEIVPSGDATRITQAVASDCEFADALAASGEPVRPVLLNVAVGNPFHSEVDLLLPAVEKVCQLGGAIGYHCFSSDTDILTEVGWLSLSEVVEQKLPYRVATLNRETGETEYQQPTNFFVYDYDGPMIHTCGKVDILVTPNHRTWIRENHEERRLVGNHQDGFKLVEASDLPNRFEMKRDLGKYEGEEKKYFTLPAYSNRYWANNSPRHYHKTSRQIKMDDWVRFFGYWITEGSLSRHAVVITQSPGETCDKISESIKRIGYKPNYYRYQRTAGDFKINDVQLRNYLMQFGKAKNKFISRELLSLSQRQLSILFDAMMEGDGHWGESSYYCTASHRLADDFQELALKLNFTATLSQHCDGYFYITLGTSRKTPATTSKYVETIEYQGSVYCVSVPNELIFTRRNGKPSWQGNSYWAASLELDLFDDYWTHHAGRWQMWDEVFRSQGLYPRYILGEAGVCGWNGDWLPRTGWKSPQCYNDDWAWYLQRIQEFEHRLLDWNTQHGNRCLGACLFTTGSPATGWETFQIQQREMKAL